MKKHMVECDACGKSKSIDDEGSDVWYQVATAATPNQYMDVMRQLQEGAELKDLIDNGDFCSLICLANWASARASLRALSDD